MGVETYSNKQHLVTITQLYIISIAGVLIGLPIVWHDQTLMFIYLIASSVDLNNVYTYFTASKKDRKLTQKDFVLKQIKDFEKLSREEE